MSLVYFDGKIVNLDRVMYINEKVLEGIKYTRFYFTPHDWFDIKGQWLDKIKNYEGVFILE